MFQLKPRPRFNLNTTQAREMGNRGYKSNYIKFVKEQRANGCYINKKIKDLVLRCALRGLERKSMAGNPSNIIINKRLYTTTTAVSSENLPKLANGEPSGTPSPRKESEV